MRTHTHSQNYSINMYKNGLKWGCRRIKAFTVGKICVHKLMQASLTYLFMSTLFRGCQVGCKMLIKSAHFSFIQWLYISTAEYSSSSSSRSETLLLLLKCFGLKAFLASAVLVFREDVL